MVEAARGRADAGVVQLPARAGDRLRAPADRRGPARHRSSTTTRPTSSSGAPTRHAPATWKMDPAQAGSGVADDLLTHLLDTALYLNGPITQGDRRRPHDRAEPPDRRCGDGAGEVRERQRRHVRGDALRDRLQEPEHVPDARRRRDAAIQPRAAESSRVPRRDAAVDRTGAARSARHRHEASGLRQLLAARPHHRLRAHVHRRARRVPRVPGARTRRSIRTSPTRSSPSRRSTRCCSSAKTRQWTDVSAADRESSRMTSPNTAARTRWCPGARRRRRASPSRNAGRSSDCCRRRSRSTCSIGRCCRCSRVAIAARSRISSGPTRSTATSPSPSTSG